MTPIPLQETQTLVEATGIGWAVLVASLGITALWLYTIYNYEPNWLGKPTDRTN